MFYEMKITSNLHIPPSKFRDKHIDEIMEKIQTSYCNKVIPNYGLVVCVTKIDSIDDPLIAPDTGGTYVQTTFRLAMFKPYDGEVILGTVANQDPSGIQVRIGKFYQDVFIPNTNLEPRYEFHSASCSWCYKQSDNPDGNLKIDKSDKIKLKVTRINFNHKEEGEENKEKAIASDLLKTLVSKAKMSITGSLLLYGLGPVEWWGEGNSDSDDGNSDDSDDSALSD